MRQEEAPAPSLDASQRPGTAALDEQAVEQMAEIVDGNPGEKPVGPDRDAFPHDGDPKPLHQEVGLAPSEGPPTSCSKLR